jgi:peptidoglycan/LPS O-acetylase OafA/YrhL
VSPLGFVAQYGFAGVEVFIFVSGFGLYHSLDKDGSLMHFYRKRLLRIFPTYYLLGISASLLIFHDSLTEYLFRYSTIGFWTGGLYEEWYVPSIVALYLAAPLLKKLVDWNRWATMGFAVLLLAAAWWFIDKETLLSRSHFFFIYRIPAFLLGMTCARWLKNGVSPKNFLVLLLAGLPCFALLYPHHHEVYNYKYFSILFLLPTFLVLMALFSKYVPRISSLTRRMGVASLEIYLIQTIIFCAIISGQRIVPAAWHDAASILFIISSTITGIIVHWSMDRFVLPHLFSR